MNRKTDFVLGIDTSNYKTSVAVVDEAGNILCDLRRLLKVKQGERGLRQSDALFQHMENLPVLLQEAFADGRNRGIRAVAFSDRPRPVEGSYMPVFKAGIGFGQAAAAALQVPCLSFSHQEGHIEAIRAFSGFRDKEEFLCYHLSGGTCELLLVADQKIEKIGGSKDLSFGQVLDRVGVKMGYAFPAGQALDQMALSAGGASKKLTKIPADGLFFNLSGIETQCGRQLNPLGENRDEYPLLVRELFDKIVRILREITQRAAEETQVSSVMFTGGVSSSRYISRMLKEQLRGTSLELEFGDQRYSQDNAVGTALL